MVQCEYSFFAGADHFEQCQTEATHTITPKEMKERLRGDRGSFAWNRGTSTIEPISIHFCDFHYRYMKEGYTEARNKRGLPI